MEEILHYLQAIKPFPFKRTTNTHVRKNQVKGKAADYKYESIVLGKVHSYDKGLVTSQQTEKYKALWDLCSKLMKTKHPSFKFTTIYINKNHVSPPHQDGNNKGPSYIVGLGNYTGGQLVVGTKTYNIKNKLVQMDGNITHYTKPFTGERYSIIFLNL